MNYTPYFILTFFLFIASFSVSRAQDSQLIWTHGKAINQKDSSAVSMAQITSYTLVQTFACDSLGEFKLTLPCNDSIKITALGFEPITVKIKSNIPTDSIQLFSLKPITYMIKRVDVSGYQEFRDFKEQLRADREKQKELDPMFKAKTPIDTMAYTYATFKHKPSIITGIFQPISTIYYYTNKSERTRVKNQKLIKEDKIRSRLTRELVEQITKLEDEKLDEFMVYCNLHIKVTSSDNDETITIKVMDLYNQYQIEKD